MNVFNRFVLLAAFMLLSACGSPPDRDGPVQGRDFEFSSFAKADIDMVAEINVRHSLDYLRELARKLYVRNPNQLRRSGYATRDVALRALFDLKRGHFDRNLAGKRSADAIGLAFDVNYSGDRVAAFIVGMRTMLLDGYGGKQRFYLPDRLDPQKLYYLARNFEIAFWKLRHDRDETGSLLLLSNSLEGTGDLSFERIAGKLIGLQDHMAQVRCR